jgi:predicted dehydrogenase
MSVATVNHSEGDGWSTLPAVTAPPRIALIGISGYGRLHLQLARELRDRGAVQLLAAVIINPEEESVNLRELRDQGCAIYSDYEEMLRRHAGQIDLCLIPTGIPWHARMTIAALRAGANVLVEKPLAGELADVAAIRAAERASGRFVAVGFQDFYTPGTLWLKRELLAGAIGELRGVSALGFWPRPAAYYRRNNWAGRLTVGGVAVFDSPFNNAFGHFANLALYFAGTRPREVAAAIQVEAELFRAHAVESFDTGVARARTASGAAVWLGFSHACRTLADPEIAIEGSAGRALWSYEKMCTIFPANGAPRSYPLPDAMDTRRVMFAEVLRRLHDPTAVICDTAMAERHTELITAIHACAPVQTIPPSLIDWITPPDGTSPIPAVRGLEAAMRAAYRKHLLLREQGFPISMIAAS